MSDCFENFVKSNHDFHNSEYHKIYAGTGEFVLVFSPFKTVMGS